MEKNQPLSVTSCNSAKPLPPNDARTYKLLSCELSVSLSRLRWTQRTETLTADRYILKKVEKLQLVCAQSHRAPNSTEERRETESC